MSLYDERRLKEAFPELRLTVFRTIDSTNSEAKRQYEAGLPGPALFLAEHQENGRGRHGRSFYSPAGSGIYMTLLTPVEASYENARRATAKAAVSVCRGIREVTGLPAGIKWVNDIYLYGRKVAGILVESVLGDGEVKALVTGIGINVTTEDFPEELLQKAGSLGQDIDRTSLVTAILKKLLPELQCLKNLTYLETYRSASVVLGKKVTYEDTEGKTQEGMAVEIDGEGALVVEKIDGTRDTLNSGEVSIRFQTP